MPTLPARRRHLASSPFQPDPELEILEFASADRVIHDSYGMGRVTVVEAHAVTVDFGTKTVRLVSPYQGLTPL